MEKFTKELEPKLNSIFSDTSFCIKEAWKKEVEKFNEAEKSLGLQNIKLEKTIACLNNVMVTQKMKLEDQAKTINSLQDKNQAQTLEIDFIHKKLEGQQLQIDILEAEKKSLDARFNEVNLKLKQQRQVSNGEIPPLIPDQIEDEVKKEQNPSTPLENITQPLVSKQEKILKGLVILRKTKLNRKFLLSTKNRNVMLVLVVCITGIIINL